MEDKNILIRVFDNYASKTLLALFGLIGTIITIYAFFQEQNVDVRYEIIANTNVLDFNADISKLEVTYDSTNLKQTKENLRIFTIRIVNNGSKSVIKEFYDENDLLGLKTNLGKIIEKPEIIKTSNDYLNRNLKIVNYQNSIVTFSQVILEPDEYFIVKLLILHKKDALPQISSIGKIAGQREIKVVNSVDVKEETSFIKSTFQGAIWMQLLRLLSYFLVGVIIIIAIVFTSQKIDDAKENKRKVKIVEGFKQTKNYSYTRMDDALFDRYLRYGYYSISDIKTVIKDDNELNEIYTKLSTQLKSKEFRRFRKIDENGLHHYYDYDSWTTINEMIKDGIVIKDNDKLSINQAMKDTLNKFVDYAIENGELKRNRRPKVMDFVDLEESTNGKESTDFS